MRGRCEREGESERKSMTHLSSEGVKSMLRDPGCGEGDKEVERKMRGRRRGVW